MNNENTIELWEPRIRNREQSGMSVNVWCKANNLERSTYYYWYKKIKATQVSDPALKIPRKKSTKKPVKKQIFAEMAPLETPVNSKEISHELAREINITWKSFSIKIKNSKDIEMVVELMKQLEFSC